MNIIIMCMTRRWSRDPDSSRKLVPSTDCRNFIVHPRTTNDLIYSSAEIAMSALLCQRLHRRSFWPRMCTQWMYMWLHTINIFIITLLFIWTLSVTIREDHQSKDLNVGQMVKANGMDFSSGFIVFQAPAAKQPTFTSSPHFSFHVLMHHLCDPWQR